MRNTKLERSTIMGYEPPLDDDIALGKDEDEELEEEGYQEPDRMWGDE